MATIVTEHALKGYHDEENRECAYLRTSPEWYGYQAGKTLRICGASAPEKATMGRGARVNIWTATTKFAVIFGANDDVEHIRRVNE
jgi:hypothetical protein